MNAPCGMTRDLRGVDAALVDQPPAAVLGVDDDRVDALVEAALRVVLPAASARAAGRRAR